MKDVQCYELFGGIALKNHAFSFSIQYAVFRNSIRMIYVYLYIYIDISTMHRLLQFSNGFTYTPF